MARAKIVVLAERNGLMRKDGLWLTSGGRVVKPGWGEYTREDFGDIDLMGPSEIETGISMEAFNARWKHAIRKWKRRKHANSMICVKMHNDKRK